MSAIRRNIIWMLISQAATWMVTVVLLVLAPRKLDADGFGAVSFAAAYVAFFTLVGGLGTSAYIVRRVARDHSEVASLVMSALKLKVVVSALLTLAALALAWLLDYRGQPMTLIAIGCIGMWFILLNEVVAAGLVGMERMARPAIWQTVQVYVSSGLAVVCLLLDAPIEYYVLSLSIGAVIPLVANYFNLRPFLRRPPRQGHPRRVPWRPIVVGGLPLLALSVLNVIYGTIDVPILQSISGSDAVGWYTVALKWAGMPIFVTTIVGTAFFPSMSSAAHTARATFVALTNRALRLVLFVTIPAAVGLVCIASDLLRFFYNHQYDESIPLLQILALQIPIIAIDTVLATALIAADRQNRYLLVALSAAILNVPIGILAIRISENRYGNGAIGAAILTVGTEAFIMVCALALRPKGVMDRHTVGFLVRCLAAAGITAVVLVIFKNVGLFVKVAVGGATYGVASLALGTVSVTRVKALIRDVKGIRGGGAGSKQQGGYPEMSDLGVDQ